MLTKITLGIEVSEDRRHTAIVAAGRVDAGVVLVDLLAYLDGTATAPAEVERIRGEQEVTELAVDPHSPGTTLIRPLTEAGFTVTEPSTSDVVIAHGRFLDELTAGRLRHAGQPQLDTAVRHCTQRPLGGAATWQRRGTAVDVSPLTAATLAVWALLVSGADYDLVQSVY